MRKIIVAGLAVFIGITTTRASLAQWTFETSTPDSSGPYAAENGVFASTSMASGAHVDANSTTYSSPSGAGSDHSYSAKNWSKGDYYQFTTSTLGYENVTVNFEAASTSTGPKNFDLAYSIDGSSFAIFTSFSVLDYGNSSNPSWNSSMSTGAANYSFHFDLSSIGSLDNQSTIYLRMIQHDDGSTSGGTVSGGGRTRLDDFTISANPLPEPLNTVAVPEPSTFLAGAAMILPLVFLGVRRLMGRSSSRKSEFQRR